MGQTSYFMSDKKIPKLIGLFFLGIVLLNFPIINLFGKNQFIFGIPALYAYFFLVWLVLIIFIAWTVRSKQNDK